MGQQSFDATKNAWVNYDSAAVDPITTKGATMNAATDTKENVNWAAFVGFDTRWATDKYKVVTAATVRISGRNRKTLAGSWASIQCSVSALAGKWEAEELIKNPPPYESGTVTSATLSNTTASYEWEEIPLLFSNKRGLTLAALYGVKINANATGYLTFESIETQNKPKLIITTSEETATGEINDLTPSGGYINLGEKNTFTFSFKQKESEPSIAPLKVEQFTLQWRESGSTEINNIVVTSWAGETPSYIAKAGTFSGVNLEWRIVAKTNAGQTITTEWISITTVDATPKAVASSPNGTAILRKESNVFKWANVIASNTKPKKSELQKSEDGKTWSSLATVTGGETQFTVPANTFAKGVNYWRVRTYNQDGVASEWSEIAWFEAIEAPSAPSIVIQSTGPRPRITWQTTEQEAYQLTLSSGYASGTVYGTEKAWRSPVYLADGSYTVRVRVQNKYGMWSEWSAATLPISHTEGEAITLTATAGHEAALTWQTAGSYDFYLIERDGVAIASTVQKQYIDHTSIGSVTYRVRGCYDESDNYGVSNSDTVEILPETNMICDLETGVWLEMRLSETQLRTNRTSFSAGVSTIHLAGLAYPVEERSEQRDRAMSVACAWPHAQRAAALALEALVGRLVCLKDRYGNMAIGSLPSLESNCDEFMRRYSFTISHTNREEAITLDP